MLNQCEFRLSTNRSKRFNGSLVATGKERPSTLSLGVLGVAAGRLLRLIPSSVRARWLHLRTIEIRSSKPAKKNRSARRERRKANEVASRLVFLRLFPVQYFHYHRRSTAVQHCETIRPWLLRDGQELDGSSHAGKLLFPSFSPVPSLHDHRTSTAAHYGTIWSKLVSCQQRTNRRRNGDTRGFGVAKRRLVPLRLRDLSTDRLHPRSIDR